MKRLSRANLTAVLLAFFTIIMAACSSNTKKKNTEASPDTTMQTEADTTSAPGTKLNMNTATGDEFRTIPNVGDRMVHEFEEYRPYVSIQQFRKEIGKYVDDEQVKAYEAYIYVPIDQNDSDVPTLMQIPGLDESEAKKLAEGRPYETTQAFFDALSQYISDEEMAIAKIYLK